MNKKSLVSLLDIVDLLPVIFVVTETVTKLVHRLGPVRPLKIQEIIKLMLKLLFP